MIKTGFDLWDHFLDIYPTIEFNVL